MMTFSEARQTILNSVRQLDTETIAIADSLNRILACDVLADADMPAFDKSAMDGYACRRDDLSKPLDVIEVISAGQDPTKTVSEGFCAKFMTGAKIPLGADWVIKVEDTRVEKDQIIFTGKVTKNSNIRFIGEEYKKGDILLPKGHKIRPQDVAILSAVGYISFEVYKQPRVAVLATGNELVEPDQQPKGYQIRNSNALQMLSQLKALGLDATYLGIIRDDKEETKKILRQAEQNFDVILSSGGVSMGDYDYIPEVLQTLGFVTKVHGVDMKPGKPLLFAQNARFVSCFGVPGNPVSSFVQFELMIKPFLYGLQGHVYRPRRNQGILLSENQIKQIKRQQFIPVQVTEENQVVPLLYQGSAHIGAFAMADALMEIPSGNGFLKNGDQVYVRYL